MGDAVQKIESERSEAGSLGQRYLACGKTVSMRLWDKMLPGERCDSSGRDYETVGFVVEGTAKLEVEGRVTMLTPGDSWLVPKGASHSYEILETFTAIEATSPPSQLRRRDEPENR